MNRILAGTVASLLVFTAAYADPPENRGTEIAGRASHVAGDKGAPGHANAATGGEVDSGHDFGAAVSAMGGEMGEHASQGAGGHSGGGQNER